MVPPHLLPTAADMLELACILLIGACTAGMGFLAGARRLETAFFSGWGMACLIFVGIGTLSSADLGWAALASAALGMLGLIRVLVGGAGTHDADDRLGPRVLLLGLPLLVLVIGRSDVAWDDISFWLPNLLHLCATHRFPTLADPAASSAMAAYPYGVAVPGFAMHLLGFRDVDVVGMEWNLLAMLAAGAAFAEVIAQRLARAGHVPTAASKWALAASGALLMGMANPTFVAKITLSNMGDSATGAGLAMLCALLFQYAAESRETPQERGLLLQISLTCCAVVFVRQANAALLVLLFLAAIPSLALFLSRVTIAAVGKLLLTLAAPAFIWWSWNRYADREIPNARHFLLAWHAWHWQVFPSALRAASGVMVAKSGYTAMALVVGCVAANCLLRRARGRPVLNGGAIAPASATIAVTAAGLASGNIAFILFCYLATSFDSTEVEAAISFWRFIAQTGQALTIALACIVPVAWLMMPLRWPMLARGLPFAALLLPVVATAAYRDDLTSPVPALRRIADGLRDAVSSRDPIVLVDIDGNGFAPLVVRYQLRAVDGDASPLAIVAFSHGLSAAQAEKRVAASAPYVWLAEGSAGFGRFLGSRTNHECSYLFHNEMGQYRIVRTWDIGPYRWAIPTPPSQPAGQRAGQRAGKGGCAE